MIGSGWIGPLDPPKLDKSPTISLEDMSYRIGQKIVAQKQRLVGLENAPLGHDSAGHTVHLC